MRPPTPIRADADYAERIPDLRKSNPLDWIVSAGKVVAAISAIVVAVTASTSWIVQRANRAFIAAVQPDLAAIKTGAKISDEQRIRDRTEDLKKHAEEHAADRKYYDGRFAAILRQLPKKQKPAGAAVVGSAEAP